MAAVAKSGTPSVSSFDPPVIISGRMAGEAIAAGDVCYIANDGTVMRSVGATAGALAAKAYGIAAGPASVGEAVTLYRYVIVRYGTGLTPGAGLFVDTAAGGLNDAATVGGTAPVAFVVDSTRIFFHGSQY